MQSFTCFWDHSWFTALLLDSSCILHPCRLHPWNLSGWWSWHWLSSLSGLSFCISSWRHQSRDHGSRLQDIAFALSPWAARYLWQSRILSGLWTFGCSAVFLSTIWNKGFVELSRWAAREWQRMFDDGLDASECEIVGHPGRRGQDLTESWEIWSICSQRLIALYPSQIVLHTSFQPNASSSGNHSLCYLELECRWASCFGTGYQACLRSRKHDCLGTRCCLGYSGRSCLLLCRCGTFSIQLTDELVLSHQHLPTSAARWLEDLNCEVEHKGAAWDVLVSRSMRAAACPSTMQHSLGTLYFDVSSVRASAQTFWLFSYTRIIRIFVSKIFNNKNP